MHAVESSAVDRSFGPRSWVRTNGINLSDGYPTLPEILRNAGCRTILAGKPGLVARAPVSLLDFLPTVLDLACVDYPRMNVPTGLVPTAWPTRKSMAAHTEMCLSIF